MRVKNLAVATLVVAIMYSLSAFAGDKVRLVSPSGEKAEVKTMKIGGVEYEVLDPASEDGTISPMGNAPEPKIVPKEKPKERQRPLGAYLPNGWIWAGTGSLHSKKWDGPWSSIEGGLNLFGPHQLYVGWSDWSGDGPGPNKYRGTGDERRLGWQMVNVSAREQDEIRLAYVKGEEKGKSASYEQETDFAALDLRLARTWFWHHQTFLSGGTLEFVWRKQLSIEKDSSFKGAPLTRAQDPIDGPGVRHIQLAPDLVHKLFRNGRLRISLAPVYERQWWEEQSPIERDLLGARVRLTHRGAGQSMLDVMPYRVENSKGIMLGFSWSH